MQRLIISINLLLLLTQVNIATAQIQPDEIKTNEPFHVELDEQDSVTLHQDQPSAEVLNAKGESFFDKKDYTNAIPYFRKAAEQGYARAQCNLGYCYEQGSGVTKDYSEAVKWYRKAAEQGHARAQYNLGLCYYKGSGVTKDYSEAVKWYKKAAEQGDADAQRELNQLYGE